MTDPDGAQHEESGAREPAAHKPSFSYRIRSAIHKVLPNLVEHPELADSRAYYEEADPKYNAETTPPDCEQIDLRCIWGVEFYTPAHTEELAASFARLGWSGGDGVSRNDPAAWMRKLSDRTRGGAWLNLGYIRRAYPVSGISILKTAPLPPHVEYARGGMFALTPSLACIVIGFVFDEDYARKFDDALRLYRRTYFSPRKKGYEILSAEEQKIEHIHQIRTEARGFVGGWFSRHLPGVFASGLLEGEYPTCELTTLRQAHPFPERGQGDSRPEEYLSILSMDSSSDAWYCEAMPELKFAWGLRRRHDEPHHAILSCREEDFGKYPLRHGRETTRTGQIGNIDELISALLSRWAMRSMLAGYTKHLNAIRASSTIRLRKWRNLTAVLEVLGRNISYNVDIAAVTGELLPFVEDKSLFSHRVQTFIPCTKYRGRERGHTLTKGLIYTIQANSEWLQKTELAIRDYLTQYGSILGARENLRMQRTVMMLTIIIILMTFVTVWGAIKDIGLLHKLTGVLQLTLSVP